MTTKRIAPHLVSDIFTICDYDSGNKGFITSSRKYIYHVQTFVYQGVTTDVQELQIDQWFKGMFFAYRREYTKYLYKLHFKE